MEKDRFGMIEIGVCAYFLILFSCLKILDKLWFSSAGGSPVWYLIPFAAPVLMLCGGIYLLKRYKKKIIEFSDDENPLISTAVSFIGGWVILAWVFKYLAPYFLFVIISGPLDSKAYLYPLILYGLPLTAAVVTIKKGSLKNVIDSSSERIAFLCLRIVLIFICVVSAYQMLTSFGSFIIFTPHELHPIEIRWIVSESGIAVAALILLFAPLRLKTNLKNTDGQGYIILSRQSFTLTGYLVLIVGIAEICDVLIRKYDFFDLFFFDLKALLVQLLPAMFLILIGLFFIHFGKKTILLFTLIAMIALLPGCGGKDAATASDADAENKTAVAEAGIPENFHGETVNGVIQYSDAEITKLFLTLQDELLTKLGDGYEIVPAGSEGTYEGYYYKELGLTFIFNHKLLWIDCDNNVDIHGARPGMTFEEIMKVLGDTEIKDTFIEIPENKAYEICYDFDGFTLCCESVNENGSGSWIYIVPLQQEKPVSEDDVRRFLSMDEEELIQRLGKYYSVEDWIEAPDGNRGATAYYYDELSLGFAFDQNKKVEFIYVNPYGFLLDGKTIGTNFKEIRNRFGDASVKTVDLNGEKTYELQYGFDGYDVLVHAMSPDGEYCSVFITKPE